MSRRLLPHEVHVPTWIRASELQAHADGFVAHLFDHGYRKSTILPYRAAVAHFAHWMTVRKIRVCELNEAVIRRFLTQHLSVCDCGALRQRWPHTVRAALRALLRFLRSQEVIGPACPTDPPAVVRELQAFAHYQEHVCGHTQATRAVSRLRTRAFLLGCFGRRDIRMDALSAKDVMRFINRYTANCTHRSRYTIARSIRGYLRFKALTEPYAEVLCERLPKVAQWRLASLPKSLSAAESEAVLAAARCNDATGRRDYAILRCLNDLGLRTVEVARLQLDDFDWQAGTVRIRGKGHRIDVMPLPASTGKAIVDYVRQGPAAQRWPRALLSSCPTSLGTCHGVYRSRSSSHRRQAGRLDATHRRTAHLSAHRGATSRAATCPAQVRCRSAATSLPGEYTRVREGRSASACYCGHAVAGKARMNARSTMQAKVAAYLAERRREGFRLRIVRDSNWHGLLASRMPRAYRGPLTIELASRWAIANRGGRRLTAARRIEVLRGFARYCRSWDQLSEIPPLRLFGPGHRRLTPHIYRAAELRTLMEAALELHPARGLRGETCATGAARLPIRLQIEAPRLEIVLEPRIILNRT